MFEKEIKFIGDFCLNQVKNLGQVFTFEKITSINLHHAVVCYISAELDFMIYADRRKLLQQSYFDYSGKEISDHFQKITGEIKRNKKISSDDLKKLILQAVSFNANYLVRPRWSLTKLIFNEQPIISVEELQMMLNYLYYYEYFRKVLSAYLSKRKLVQISLTEFDLILNKIDSELFSSSQEQLVENALISMGDFFNIGGVDKNLVSSTAIEIFLKEKNMLELVFKLRKEVPEGQKKRYDKNDLKRVLFSTSNEANSEKITITDSEIVIDGHESLNEESEKPDLEELAGKYANEMEKTDVDSFLSPEEEETLLSLYDDEIKELSEETRNQFPESDIGTVKTSIDDIDKMNYEQEEEETESLNLEELSLTDSEVSKSLFEEIPKLDKTEFSEQIEIESESTNQGIEKEIVEEMIRDFVGEEKSSESSDKSSTGNLEVNTFQSTADLPELNTLENELLSIFEDLDKDNVGIPSDEIMIEEIKEVQDEEKNGAKDLFAPFLEEDGIDDYLKSIDEIVSPERNEKAVVDKIEENIK